MRYIAAILSVMLLAVLSASAAGATDKLTVKLFIESPTAPAPLPAEKSELVKDGITLKSLVDALGPGWIKPNDGVGIIRWVFTDGRVLSVWPHSYTDAEVIVLSESHGQPGQMWWRLP